MVIAWQKVTWPVMCFSKWSQSALDGIISAILNDDSSKKHEISNIPNKRVTEVILGSERFPGGYSPSFWIGTTTKERPNQIPAILIPPSSIAIVYQLVHLTLYALVSTAVIAIYMQCPRLPKYVTSQIQQQLIFLPVLRREPAKCLQQSEECGYQPPISVHFTTHGERGGGSSKFTNNRERDNQCSEQLQSDTKPRYLAPVLCAFHRGFPLTAGCNAILRWKLVLFPAARIEV